MRDRELIILIILQADLLLCRTELPFIVLQREVTHIEYPAFTVDIIVLFKRNDQYGRGDFYFDSISLLSFQDI